MTYEEARKTIMSDADYGGVGEKAKKTADALCIAIEALEKQIPKKPNYQYAGEFGEQTEYYCDCCGDYLSNTEDDDMHFCQNCGQAIDWSEEEVSE